MESNIAQAVQEHQIVTFLYDGIARMVEAHAYGVHKDTQSEILFGFQLGGSRATGDLAGWKAFRVECITFFKPTEKRLSHKPPRHGALIGQFGKTYAQAWETSKV
jgi:hypothetical protein